MIEQENRLMVAEMRIDQHEKMHRETQESVRILSMGISKLVEAEIRREQDGDTFNRIAGDISSTREESKSLRKDLEEYKDKQVEKELAAYRGIVWKILGLAAIVMASVIAGHLGGKWLG